MQLPDENIEYHFQRLLAQPPEAWTPLAELQAQHFLSPDRLEAVKPLLNTVRGQVAAERELLNPPAKMQPLQAKDLAFAGQQVFGRLEKMTKPSIAMINGFALGGGCELAMSCHVRIASDAAKFGQPEVKLGICPGYGGTQRLPRLVGMGRALQLLMTGEIIDAAEAYRIGLVNRVVAGAELLAAADALLRQMLANAPLALASCIETVVRGTEIPLDDALNLEANHFALLAGSQDMAEGTRAFLEKRPPVFAGR